MEKFGIETSQNVFIQHEAANVGERIVAQLLDNLFIFSYIIILTIISGILGSNSASGVIIFILVIPAFFYSFIFELFFHGQSLGKMIMKLQVVKLDGTQATIGNYFIRWIFRIIDVLLFYGAIGIFTIVINGKGQRLGDIVAKTSVIKLKKRISLSETILIQLPADYTLKFEETKKLSEKDINTIREVLNFYKKNNSQQAQDVIMKTSEALCKKIGINHSLSSREFLQTLLQDYNYINSHEQKS